MNDGNPSLDVGRGDSRLGVIWRLVMPALPGHMLIFAGLLVGAWAEGFTRVGVWTMVVLGLIALASYGVDFVAVAVGARRLGASPRP